MIMSGGSSSSTAVNPPTPSLSSLASSTPPSSEYIYVNGNMTNTTPPMTTSYDTLQMSLVSLGQNVSLEEALIRVSDLMRENSDLKAVLQQNNHAMKEQCHVLSSVKQQWAAEREEMKHKFEQTRDVILKLRRTVEDKENRLTDLQSQLSQKSGSQNGIMTKEESPSLSAQMNSLRQRREEAEKQAELHSAQNKFLQKQTDKLNDKITELIEAKSNLESEKVRLRERNEQLRKELGELKKLTVRQQENQDHLVKEKQELMRLNNELSSQVQSLKEEMMCPAARSYRDTSNGDLFGQDYVLVPSKPESPSGEAAISRLTPLTEESENHAAESSETQSESENHAESSGNHTEPSDNHAETDNHAESDNHAGSEQNEESDTTTPSSGSSALAAVKSELEEERKKIQVLQQTLKEQKDLVESLQKEIEEKDNIIVTAKEEMDTTVDRLKKDHRLQIEDLKSKLKIHTDYGDDVATLRAQVVSLVKELCDTEERLREANEDIERYKHSCTELQNRVSIQEVEVSKERSREDRLNEDLRNRIARLEATLRQEQEDKKKKEVSLQELRLNFDKLCNDYHELLESHEDYKAEQKAMCAGGLTPQQRAKLDEKLDNLTAQIIIAEEAITQKDDQISDLKDKLKNAEEEMCLLRAQVEVYKRDFEEERGAREKLNEEKERWREKAMQLKGELDAITHGGDVGPRPSSPESDLVCPICQRSYPDMDSLRIHLQDCPDEGTN